MSIKSFPKIDLQESMTTSGIDSNRPIQRAERIVHQLVSSWMIPSSTNGSDDQVSGTSKLPALINIFQVKIPPESTFEEQRELCFEAVVLACHDHQWDKINKARDALVGLRDGRNRPVFTALLEREDKEITESVIKKEFHRVLADGNFDEAMHRAVRLGRFDLVPLLWECTSIDQLDSKGQTPLHEAINFSQVEMVDALLKNGANPQISYTPVPLGTSLADTPGKATFTAFSWAVAKGEVGCFDMLSSHSKIDWQETVDQIGSFLHVAIQFRQSDMLQHLLTKYHRETAIVIETKDSLKRTPLLLAAALGDVESIEFLHRKGANLASTDCDGQTALHLAALNNRKNCIQLLIHLGADLMAVNKNKQLAMHLGNIDTQNFVSNLSKQAKQQAVAPPNFSLSPARTLVFKGGGPRGFAYIGAVLELESLNALGEVVRCAGTSAGAITATLLSFGFSGERIYELLKDMPLTRFLDHPFAMLNLIPALKNNLSLKGLWNVLQFMQRMQNPLLGSYSLELGRQIFERLWKCTGLCEGEEFRKWIEKCIKEATGIDHCTFGELKQLIAQGKPFKDLHIFSCQIGPNPKLFHFSFEDPQWDHLIISDAVRASMSIPGVFKAHILHFKNALGARHHRDDLGSFVDGGLICNFPINEFDFMKYQQNGLASLEGACPSFNRNTLGFNFFTPADIPKDKPVTPIPPVNTVHELLMGVWKLIYGAEDLIRQSNGSNIHRVIEIDDKGVGLLPLDIDKNQQHALMASGKKAVRDFFKGKVTNGQTLFILPSQQSHRAPRVNLKAPLENFIPRNKQLDKLKKRIPQGEWVPRGPVVLQALCGPGGVGKSELACYFANKNLHQFSIVASIDCRTIETRLIGYQDLAKALRIYLDDKASPEQIFKIVTSRLDQNTYDKPWLLILDNVEENLLLPQQGGYILGTSTRKDVWPSSEICLEIPSFSEQEGIALLKQVTEQNDESSMKLLVKELGSFPLALGQAAVYIAETGVPVAEYLRILKENRSLPLREGTSRHPISLERTWILTLERLRKYHPYALEWLNVCVYFNPVEIPQAWIYVWLKNEKKLIGAELRNVSLDILRTLQNYCLIQSDPQSASFSLHPLTRKMIRSLQKEEAQSFYKTAIRLLVLSRQGWNMEHTTEWVKEMKAITQWVSHVKELNLNQVEDRDKIDILLGIGRYEFMRGNYREVLRCVEEAHKPIQAIFGQNNYYAAERLNLLALCYSFQARYKEALTFFTQAHEILKVALGEKHPEVADSLRGMAHCYFHQREYATALTLNTQVLEIQKAALGERHPAVGASLNNIANCYLLVDREKALKLYTQALEIQKEALGERHPAVAGTLLNIGRYNYLQGKYTEALKLHIQVMEILKAVLGENHPDVARNLSCMAKCYYSQGNYAQALQMYNQAFAIMKANCLDNHPDAVRYSNKIRQCEEKLKRWCAIV